MPGCPQHPPVSLHAQRQPGDAERAAPVPGGAGEATGQSSAGPGGPHRRQSVPAAAGHRGLAGAWSWPRPAPCSRPGGTGGGDARTPGVSTDAGRGAGGTRGAPVGGQRLPLPAGSPRRGRPPAVSCRGWGGRGRGAERAAPSPARAARRLRSRQREAAALVTCVGRFLRQHRTGGTGCQHRGLSRATPPGALEPAVGATTGPSVPPPGLAPAGSSALAGPWWAGFGLGAGARRLVPWSCPRRAGIPAEPHAMAAPPCWESPQGEIWVKPPPPGAGGGPASLACPGGHPLPLLSRSHCSHFPLGAVLPRAGPAAPFHGHPLAGFPQLLVHPRPWGNGRSRSFPSCRGGTGCEAVSSEGCRGRSEGFKPARSGAFKGAGAGAEQITSISSARMHQVSWSC